MNFFSVHVRKFHPACQDNFVVVTLFGQLLKIACGGIFDLLGPHYMEASYPAKRVEKRMRSKA